MTQSNHKPPNGKAEMHYALQVIIAACIIAGAAGFISQIHRDIKSGEFPKRLYEAAHPPKKKGPKQ